MEELNINDLSEMRRQRKKRRNTQKFLGFMILLTIVLGLYVSKERWLPDIRHEDSGFTDDEISGDGFPIKISNSASFKSCSMGDGFNVLTDTRYYLFSSSGSLNETRQHFYSNSILKNAGTKTLIYEQNGNGLRVDSRKTLMYEKKVENTIYLATVNDKGYSAVVTGSDQYVCELTVFDHAGDVIYYRGCSERITDIVFNEDGKGCSIVSINASEGHIVSEIISVDFQNEETVWNRDGIASCSVAAYSAPDNGIAFFGDTMCGFYDSAGEVIQEYVYPDTLIDVSYSGSKAALVFDSKERKKTSLVLFSDPAGGSRMEIIAPDTVKKVFATEDRVYILTENAVVAYNYDGEMIRSMDTAEPFRDFYKTGKYIILVGHNKIDRIEM